MDNWIYYVVALLVIIAAAYIIKKVASCLVKLVVFLVLTWLNGEVSGALLVFLVLLAALCAGYYYLS